MIIMKFQYILPFSGDNCLKINCSLNENEGTRSTPWRSASFINPFRFNKYNFTSFFDQNLASNAPPGTRTVTVPFGFLS